MIIKSYSMPEKSNKVAYIVWNIRIKDNINNYRYYNENNEEIKPNFFFRNWIIFTPQYISKALNKSEYLIDMKKIIENRKNMKK